MLGARTWSTTFMIGFNANFMTVLLSTTVGTTSRRRAVEHKKPNILQIRRQRRRQYIGGTIVREAGSQQKTT